MIEVKSKWKWKYLVGIIGVLLTIFGWTVSNSDRMPGVQRLIVPDYARAMSAYTRLHTKNIVLTEDDEGFRQIAELLKQDIVGDVEPDITQIKTLDWGSAAVNTDQGIQWQQYIELEISFSNSKPVAGKIRELESRINEAYQNRSLFLVSTLVFWFGILLSLVAVFL